MRNVAALRAMAEQDVSPHELDIARAKLEAMGAWPPPPRPPAPPAAAPAPMPSPFHQPVMHVVRVVINGGIGTTTTVHFGGATWTSNL